MVGSPGLNSFRITDDLTQVVQILDVAQCHSLSQQVTDGSALHRSGDNFTVQCVCNQLIADALDREVVTGPVEGAAIGNLLTQAMALGDIQDLDALRQVVRNSESVETWTPNHTAAWDEAYETLLKLL